MGLNAIKSVLENSKATGSDRLVLMILAYHQNDETGECFPSRQLICEESGIKERNLIYRLNALESLGELTISRGNGSGNTTRYKLNLTGERVQAIAPFVEDKGCKNAYERVQDHVIKGAKTRIAYKEEQKEQKEQKESPFQNPGIGDALEDTFPGHASNFRLMGELHQLCEKLQATADDVRRFPDWLKKTYPMKAISPFALKDLLSESLKSRPVVKVPDPNLCPTCRGKKVVLKNGMDKFRGGTPTMPCPTCSNVTSNNSTENSNVITSNRFAIA